MKNMCSLAYCYVLYVQGCYRPQLPVFWDFPGTFYSRTTAVITVRDAILTCNQKHRTNNYIHTHTRLTALCPRLPGWAGTRKVKPIWILLKQATVSGSGISCTQLPTTQFFTARMHFLPPNQQCQSTEGKERTTKNVEKLKNYKVKNGYAQKYR